MLDNRLAAIGLGLAWSLLISSAQAAQSYKSVEHSYVLETVVEGLQTPWSMAWLPSGEMLVTEREGSLYRVRDGKLSQAIAGVPAVLAKGQGGLFEVLVHPNFADNQLIYLSYAKPMGDSATTAVLRGRLVDSTLTDIEEIFVSQTEGKGHYGGRLVFDQAGFLYVTIGDRQASPSGDLAAHPSQDRSNHHGVVVRLQADGTVPADNPFVGDDTGLDEIWSYGHRNPQGLAVHPQTGALFSGEHGPQGGDEINIVEPGKNYGWPVIGYGVNYGMGTPIHASQSDGTMEQPAHYWVPSIATAGLAIYSGDKFP
ncbi:MAG: glucose/arabinose dehydrogenase, partial [Paraglaciecola psychrophila]